MKNNPSLLLPAFSIVLLSTFFSCKKNEPAAPLTLDATPANSAGGGNVTLTGTGFSSAANDHVTINGVTATVTSATSTSITFTVPAKVGSGPITLTVNGQTLNGPAFTYDTAWAVTTFAGSGTPGSQNGTGTAAQFNNPAGVCFDGAGNLYVTEAGGNSVRKITPFGVVTTLAGGTQGSTNGQGTAAAFNHPLGICIDPSGNLFVADGMNKSIRKITSSGLVSTVYTSTPSLSFGLPTGICTDGAGNLFVTDQYLDYIAKIDANGTATMFAGNGNPADKDGTGTAAEFAFPAGICIDAQQNMYVAELNKNIRKITPAGVVTTISSIINPYFICVDAQQRLYVSGFAGISVSGISTAGVINTIAGSTPGVADAIGIPVPFKVVAGIAIDASGDLYVADGGNNQIYKLIWR